MPSQKTPIIFLEGPPVGSLSQNAVSKEAKKLALEQSWEHQTLQQLCTVPFASQGATIDVLPRGSFIPLVGIIANLVTEAPKRRKSWRRQAPTTQAEEDQF